MRELFPGHRELPEDSAYADLRFGERAPSDRPFVAVNMVATADGRARIGPDTTRLGGETDRRLFLRLREQVDCVMAGTRTIAAEHYGGPARLPETQARREQRGLRPRPLMATATRSGDVPWDAPLFADPGAEIVIFGVAPIAEPAAIGDAGDMADPGEQAGPVPTRAQVTQVRTDDPVAMLRELRGRFGVRSLLLEGGPALNTAFFAAGVVDELFLTVAPVLSGEPPFPIVAGPLPRPVTLAPVGVLMAGDELFLRYRVVNGDGA